MKVGNLVKHKRVADMGYGLVTGVDHHSAYAWVRFRGPLWHSERWVGDKWCETKDLEVVSESR